jgi:hypothetical protein
MGSSIFNLLELGKQKMPAYGKRFEIRCPRESCYQSIDPAYTIAGSPAGIDLYLIRLINMHHRRVFHDGDCGSDLWP